MTLGGRGNSTWNQEGEETANGIRRERKQQTQFGNNIRSLEGEGTAYRVRRESEQHTE